MLRASIPVAGASTRSDLLEELVDAVVGDDPARAAGARRDVVEQLGEDWLVDACAVVANFEMMTRLADGTGARLRSQQLAAAEPMIEQLGLDAFPSVRR
jgi:hypothetical protein